MKGKMQFVVVLGLAVLLAGCFEPSGKNFEGKWVEKLSSNIRKPVKIDISCAHGYCEFKSVFWDVPYGKYLAEEVSNPRIEKDDILIWEGTPVSARYKEGRIYWGDMVFERLR